MQQILPMQITSGFIIVAGHHLLLRSGVTLHVLYQDLVASIVSLVGWIVKNA